MDDLNAVEHSDMEINETRQPKTGRKPKLRTRLWTFGAVLSIVVNLLLVAIVVLLANQLFSIKEVLTSEVFGGLYYNFLLMDQAEIKTSIDVEASLPVQFDLPLNQQTTVVLSEDTKINGVRVTVVTGGLKYHRRAGEHCLAGGYRTAGAFGFGGAGGYRGPGGVERAGRDPA